ncbi:MAG: penicillin-binding protein [Flavobacteriales bacterium]|nr:penicillin-binding protein [Flavobacteriales bacterium]|tara:strand:- start:9976 stop:11961 length:1986 start_codon:yes stop_codon:yes gene_type:complete
MSIKNPFRLTLITVLILLFAWSIIIKIINVISTNEYAEQQEIVQLIVPANRGNIYSYDNKLLAVTSSTHDLYFDGLYAKATVKKSDLEILSIQLSQIFRDKSSEDYLFILRKAISKNNRYALIKRNVSFNKLKSLKESQYFKNPLQGGLIIETNLSREKPNGNSAARTIGDLYKDKTPKYGLEYSYNAELMGQDGKSSFIKKPGAGKIKIKDGHSIESRDGQDLITTLDLDLQDIVEQALLRQLEIYKADFGTAILMEVKTGRIKSISNLKKVQNNKYAEILNFGVSLQLEPGSTIKLASLMAYLEDSDGNIEDTIDCKNGQYQFRGSPIPTKDSKKLGVVTLKEAFAHSSNIGIGRLIKDYYKNRPEKFIQRFYNFGLGTKSKIDLSGAPEPIIPAPNDKHWSGISLPWMSFGYGINLTTLDILTFYNAVANDGNLIHPYLGSFFREGSDIHTINRDDISHTICSKSTIEKVKILLKEVVHIGTGKQLIDLPFSVSGKTGTTVKNYTNLNDDNDKQYQSSFVGFFPSEKPQYSCIVLIDNPDKNIGYYGSVVAIPVFKEIAHKIYVKEGLEWSTDLYTNSVKRDSIKLSFLNIENELENKLNFNKKKYPNVVGMHIRDALQLLENAGYNVIIKGDFGIVKKQYPKSSSPVRNDLAITLFI